MQVESIAELALKKNKKKLSVLQYTIKFQWVSNLRK